LGPETSDEQLMLAFKSGDARAFEALVRRHRTPVFNFILRYVGLRSRAEDLLQETWLKVVRGAQDYQPKARFTTWVYTIARNLCVDSARKESYRAADSLDQPAKNGEDDGRALAETMADGQLLEKALQSLPEEQREVFVLREFSGVPFKDIAAVTGVPENTVKSRMRYALEGLRKRLDELGVDGDLAEGRVAG
jgi:RNA polymerase sigma-70 factor, ECF subfamily